MTRLQIVAFGDAGPELWGASWVSTPDETAGLAVRHGPVSAILEARLEGPPGPEDPWRFQGPEASLAFAPTGPPILGHDAEGHLELRNQGCEVRGQLSLDGASVEVDCLGWRSAVEGDSELGQAETFRFLAGWLNRGFGFSLFALRSRKARGHEADIVAATVLEEAPPARVDEPRLSTTYTDAGLPVRAGLELWLGTPSEDGDADGEPPQYPRRAAGESTGPGLDWTQQRTELRAVPMHWYSHGLEGPGIYLLGRRR